MPIIVLMMGIRKQNTDSASLSTEISVNINHLMFGFSNLHKQVIVLIFLEKHRRMRKRKKDSAEIEEILSKHVPCPYLL